MDADVVYCGMAGRTWYVHQEIVFDLYNLPFPSLQFVELIAGSEGQRVKWEDMRGPGNTKEVSGVSLPGKPKSTHFFGYDPLNQIQEETSVDI